MKSEYIRDILNIIHHTRVISEDTYRVGEASHRISNKSPYYTWKQTMAEFGNNSGDVMAQKSNLVQQVAFAIYSHFYSTGDSMNVVKKLIKPPPLEKERKNFVDRLSNANRTSEGYDLHWTIYSVSTTGQMFAQKNGRIRQLMEGEYIPVVPGPMGLGLNQKVNILRQRESRDTQSIFYHVFSEELFSQQADIIRFYFNLRPEGAAVLIENLTTYFNKYRLPFSFKCLNHNSWFDRADSAVLYLEKPNANIGFRILKMILPNIKAYCKPNIPLFSKLICPGISFAEDPGRGMSFGMSRSLILAEAIYEVYEKGIKTEKDILKYALKRYKSEGININAPYLSKDSHYPYPFNLVS